MSNPLYANHEKCIYATQFCGEVGPANWSVKKMVHIVAPNDIGTASSLFMPYQEFIKMCASALTMAALGE